METQLKRGLLEYCVLAVLQRQESYGYQIVKDAAQYIGLSESTLYPILRRLEQNGLVGCRTEEHSGRLRKYYSITQAGQSSLAQFAAELPQLEQVLHFIAESKEEQH